MTPWRVGLFFLVLCVLAFAEGRIHWLDRALAFTLGALAWLLLIYLPTRKRTTS